MPDHDQLTPTLGTGGHDRARAGTPRTGGARSRAVTHQRLISTFGGPAHRPNGRTLFEDRPQQAKLAQPSADGAAATIARARTSTTRSPATGGPNPATAARTGAPAAPSPARHHEPSERALFADPVAIRAPGPANGSHVPSAGTEHPQAGSGDARLPHLPALDGLRGAAVVGVILFHAGFSWARGGFLGVSSFFTLSGFLITALLLREHRQSDRVSLGTFWIRRARRLLPAAIASLVLAQAVTLALGDVGQRKGLGFDTLGALVYGANWRSVIAGQSYASLFEAPSPLLHFWSLAVEEQFYLLYPLVVFGVLVAMGWSRRRFVAVLAVAAAASVALMVGLAPRLGWSVDRLYYGTDTRMAELLAGALLAGCIAHRLSAGGLRTSRASGALVAAGGVLGLGVIIVMWNQATHESPWLYHGGLVAYSLATVAVVAACAVASGPVRLVLAVAPLQWLGRISYGLYLYHWPVFLVLNPARTHIDGWWLFALRMLIAVPMAMASYRWLEMPFRRGTALQTIRVPRLAPFAVGSLLLVGFVVSTSAPEKANDFEASQRRFDEARQRATATSVP